MRSQHWARERASKEDRRLSLEKSTTTSKLPTQLAVSTSERNIVTFIDSVDPVKLGRRQSQLDRRRESKSELDPTLIAVVRTLTADPKVTQHAK